MDKRDFELAVVIPAYEPDEKLITLINDLNNKFKDFFIVVVNDGSKKQESLEVFNKVSELKNTHLISYSENRGKGFALKKAFEYIKTLEEKCVVITADSDGQHHPNDIEKVYHFFLKHEDGIVLGSREFDSKVPLKSRFGNIVSTNLTRIIFSEKLNDTQTGLRAFSSDRIDFMLSIKGDRYEYEINMISETIRASIPIHEVSIKTIYFDENKGTHFRPVRDFLRITSCQLKYSIPLLVCCLVNSIVFAIIRFVIYNSITDLDGVYLMYICLVSGLFTMLTGLIIDGLGLLYGNTHVLKRKDLILNYIIRFIIVIIMDTLFVEIYARLFNFDQNLIPLSKLLSILTVFLIVLIINFFFSHKSKLYKGGEE